MRQINLSPYGNEQQYDARAALNTILFLSEKGFSAMELAQRERIAVALLNLDEEDVAMCEDDYLVLLSSVLAIRNFQRGDVELIDRVVNAPLI